MSTSFFGVNDYDNPETIRFRKYATGAHLALRGGGVQTGQTPKEVVWERDKVRLYRYEPSTEKRFPVPVLLVYALILRPYVLDLVPGNSLVEYLVGEGFDVYLLDWGIPGEEDAQLSFEDYLLDYLPEAVRQVQESSGSEGASLFGYCQGGTMSAMYAALSARLPELPGPENLVLLATPLDFAPQKLGPWLPWSNRFFDPGLLVGPDGLLAIDLAGRLVEEANRVPEPAANFVAGFANLWASPLGGFTDSFLAVSRWVDDSPPVPGEAFRQWIRDFYQQNKLPKGEVELRGHRVELSEIACPVLAIAGSKDFICPLPQARAVMDLVGVRDKEFLVLDAGHVGLMVGPPAKTRFWPRVRDWLGPRSERT